MRPGLPAVGNDIVDLREPLNLGKSRDGRFLARVFTVEEQGRIAAAASPDALLWAFWAAKEAAYKCVGRDDSAVASIPRLYPVVIDDETAGGSPEAAEPAGILYAGRVATPRGDIVLRIAVTDQYVHAAAAAAEASLARIVHRVGRMDGTDQAGEAPAFIRGLVIREIARRLDCPVGELAVSPTGSGVPRVFLRGRPLGISISLSHDGRYAAFALGLSEVS
jgi:hypothetical protein